MLGACERGDRKKQAVNRHGPQGSGGKSPDRDTGRDAGTAGSPCGHQQACRNSQRVGAQGTPEGNHCYGAGKKAKGAIVATIAPLLGSVRGKLGALSFRKGNRVQVAGKGGPSMTVIRRNCLRHLARQWSTGLDENWKAEIKTWRGRYMGSLLYTRLYKMMAVVCADATGFPTTYIQGNGILPIQMNIPAYPLSPVPGYVPSLASVEVNENGVEMAVVWPDNVQWDEGELYCNALMFPIREVFYDTYNVDLINTFVMESSQSGNTANVIFEGVSEASPFGGYGGVFTFWGTYTPPEPQEHGQIVMGPYKKNLGTVWCSIRVNPIPEE